MERYLRDQVAPEDHRESELVTEHYWSDGVYVRRLFIPEDTLLTGEIHRGPCLNIVWGDIEVSDITGVRRITTDRHPVIFESPGGNKRAGYTFSDTIWITVHSVPPHVERTDTAMVDLLTSPSVDALELHSDD